MSRENADLSDTPQSGQEQAESPSAKPTGQSWKIDGKKTIIYCFYALLAHLILHTVILHFTIAHLNGAQEYREGAILDTTMLLIGGDHPYNPENAPTHTNVYGVTLSAIMAWLSPWVHPDLTNHRIVSGIFLFFACVVLWSVAMKSGLGKRDAFFVGAFFYIIYNLSYSVLARPDSVGVFSMLTCIRLAMVSPGRPWSVASWCASIIFAGLAFFTKPYFLFGAGCAAVYIGWHRSLKQSVVYWAGICGFLALLLVVASKAWPMYWFSTFQIHRLANTPHTEHFWSQWQFFSITHVFWLGALAAGVPGLLHWKRLNKDSIKLAWTSGIGSIVPGHWAGFCMITASVILAMSLAWHQGAYFIYFVHLLTPFVLLTGGMALKNRHLEIRETGHRIPLNSVVALAQIIVLLSVIRPVPTMEMGPYLASKTLLDRNLKLLVTPLLVPEMIEQGIEYPDNGQTEYFLACSLGFPEDTDKDILNISSEFIDDLRSKMSEAYWDRIIMVPTLFSHYFRDEDIQANYEYKGGFKHYSYYARFLKPWIYGGEGASYPVQIWERKSSLTTTNASPQMSLAQ